MPTPIPGARIITTTFLTQQLVFVNTLALRTSVIIRSLHPRAHAYRISEKDSRLKGVQPRNNKGQLRSLRHCLCVNRCSGLLRSSAAVAAARKRDSIFHRKFHRWMRKLGMAKANVALAPQPAGVGIRNIEGAATISGDSIPNKCTNWRRRS
jgi:hypothetical protein